MLKNFVLKKHVLLGKTLNAVGKVFLVRSALIKTNLLRMTTAREAEAVGRTMKKVFAPDEPDAQRRPTIDRGQWSIDILIEEAKHWYLMAVFELHFMLNSRP